MLRPARCPSYDAVIAALRPCYGAATRKADIIAALLSHEDELRRLGVVRLALFGSVQRDEAKADSDVDLIAVYAPGRLDFRSYFGAKHLIEDTLGRPVDFTTPDALHQLIRDDVLATAEPVFS